MRSNYKPIGDYIERSKVKNADDKYSELLGINIDKFFMPSVANVIGTNLSRYLIVEPGQFACNRMHVGRDYRIPIALSRKETPFIVSPAYDVFEIKDTSQLLPEYLIMWFSRSEFDRNAWYYTDADVRGGLAWDAFCSIELPVPSIEKQQEIVTEYHVVKNRIALNEQLNQKLEETAQALYKHWFVGFEFPAYLSGTLSGVEGYKSSGGAMVYNEELDKEIPEGWEKGCLGDLIQLQRGFDLPKRNRIDGDYPIYGSTGISQFHNEYKVKAPGIVTGRSGSLGEVFYVDESFWPLNTTLWIKEYKNATPLFSYFILKGINIEDYNSGSAVPTLNRNYIHMHELIVPNMQIIRAFEKIGKVIFLYKKENILKNETLTKLQTLLLSKMARVEEKKEMA